MSCRAVGEHSKVITQQHLSRPFFCQLGLNVNVGGGLSANLSKARAFRAKSGQWNGTRDCGEGPATPSTY